MKKWQFAAGMGILLAITSGTTVWAGQWKEDYGGTWYAEDNGSYPKETWKMIDGKWYYFNRAGYRLTNQWIDGTYYVGADGAMLVNTTTPDGFQVGADGAWIKSSQADPAIEEYRYVLARLMAYGGKFSVLDINGDGNLELLIIISYDYHEYSRLFYWTDSLHMAELSQSGVFGSGSIDFNPKEKALMSLYMKQGPNFEECRFDGSQLEDVNLDTGDTWEENLREYFQNVTKFYEDPVYRVVSVPMTEENRDKYLSGNGQPTGLNRIDGEKVIEEAKEQINPAFLKYID